MTYNPVLYTIEFRNADHALTAEGIVKALESWSCSNLGLTVTAVPEVAHGTKGPAKHEGE